MKNRKKKKQETIKKKHRYKCIFNDTCSAKSTFENSKLKTIFIKYLLYKTDI